MTRDGEEPRAAGGRAALRQGTGLGARPRPGPAHGDRARGEAGRPVAEEECAALLFEPTGTVNTGAVREARTRDALERI